MSTDLIYSADWIPYNAREQWADITPDKTGDGRSPFYDVLDYFRAVLLSSEKSERALELTKDVLSLYPSHVVAWQYRSELLHHLNWDLRRELQFTAEFLRDVPKNSFAWAHRRSIANRIEEPAAELAFTELALERDSENKEAWEYRKWVLRRFSLFHTDLQFTDKIIASDLRNSFVWDHRFEVNDHNKFTPEIVKRELDFAMNCIRCLKSNMHAWRYFERVLKHGDGRIIKEHPEVVAFCEELFDFGVRSPGLISLLAVIYGEQSSLSKNYAEKAVLSYKVLAMSCCMSKNVG